MVSRTRTDNAKSGTSKPRMPIFREGESSFAGPYRFYLTPLELAYTELLLLTRDKQPKVPSEDEDIENIIRIEHKIAGIPFDETCQPEGALRDDSVNFSNHSRESINAALRRPSEERLSRVFKRLLNSISKCVIEPPFPTLDGWFDDLREACQKQDVTETLSCCEMIFDQIEVRETQKLIQEGKRALSDHRRAGRSDKRPSGIIAIIENRLRAHPKWSARHVWESIPKFNDGEESVLVGKKTLCVYRDIEKKVMKLFQEKTLPSDQIQTRKMVYRTFESWVIKVRRTLRAP